MQRHSSPREVGAHRQNEEKRCVSIPTPSTSIYRPEHQCQEQWSTPETASRTNKQAPCGGPGSADQRSVRSILGSADPQVAPLGLCFLGVAVLWALRSVPGVHMQFKQFRHSGGPMDPCDAHVETSDLSWPFLLDWWHHWSRGCLHGNLLSAEMERLGLMRWKDKVCFYSISHTNSLHSYIHHNLWKLLAYSLILM
jgi:hypothetical protein